MSVKPAFPQTGFAREREAQRDPVLRIEIVHEPSGGMKEKL
jgi:hypothetical protein